jgi:dCTP deaminase
MILSDKAIRERMQRETDDKIVIDPIFSDSDIQPSSVDLHLSHNLLVFPRWTWFDSLLMRYPILQRVFRKPNLIDIACGELPEMHAESCGGYGFVLWPGCCVLGSTHERIEVPSDLVARVEGKSSLGRIFLTAHVTAGFIDAGFAGNITLEMRNLNRLPILLRSYMKISQLCFESLDEEVSRPYGSYGLNSKYQDSRGTVAAKTRP